MNHILTMIENVSPDDTAALDEIDARVWCWLKGITEEGNFTVSHNKGTVYYRHNDWPKDARTILHHTFMHPQYTRSRDALKSIRPEGWWFDINYDEYNANAYTVRGKLIEFEVVYSAPLPTEELAELHAIINAIQHERDKGWVRIKH